VTDKVVVVSNRRCGDVTGLVDRQRGFLQYDVKHPAFCFTAGEFYGSQAEYATSDPRNYRISIEEVRALTQPALFSSKSQKAQFRRCSAICPAHLPRCRRDRCQERQS
jgi:hypothetical protein